MSARVRKTIEESIAVERELTSQASLIHSAAMRAVAILKGGGKILLFGNGGSAADAQHIAAELVGKLGSSRKPLPALALTTNSSVITAISNDISFDEVFSRQVSALATHRDMVIGISTSGRSRNVIEGILAAKKARAVTLCLTGKDGGGLAPLADISIRIPSTSTQRIQEAHILIGHMICEIAESKLFPQR